jgi:hypothetical protein
MRRRHFASLISFPLLLSCSGCIPAKFTEIPALKGRVVGLDGRPAPAASVHVSRKPDTPGAPFELLLQTDSNGEFTYGGKQRWVLWILIADLFRGVVQVQARHGDGASPLRDVEYVTEVKALGLGKPQYHDVGELRVPTYASP